LQTVEQMSRKIIQSHLGEGPHEPGNVRQVELQAVLCLQSLYLLVEFGIPQMELKLLLHVQPRLLSRSTTGNADQERQKVEEVYLINIKGHSAEEP